ncbi:MAG: glycosyltransferase family 4 protein [Pirellulales bacterium]
MPRLAHLITAQPKGTQFFQQQQLADLQHRGFEVVVISAPSENLDVMAREAGIEVVAVPMEREIAPLHDVVSFFRMYRALARVRPDIISAGSPKAALLGLVSAVLLRVPVRIYVLRGLRLETVRGPLRWILGAVEWVTSACAHRVICLSESLRQKYVAGGYVSDAKSVVLGSGSSNGVQIDCYRQTAATRAKAAELRRELGIPDDAVVIGFAGRLTPDKGTPQLLAAFELVLRDNPRTYLLLVGDFERGDPMPEPELQRVGEHPNIRKTGFVWDPVPYYGVMDVLAFPSLREGFPRVPLEAAAAELPVVGFEATGTIDAVQDGVTGTIVPLGDVDAFAAALAQYVVDPSLRRRQGLAGYHRVQREFRSEQVWAAFYDEYVRLLQERGIPVGRPEPPDGEEPHELTTPDGHCAPSRSTPADSSAAETRNSGGA